MRCRALFFAFVLLGSCGHEPAKSAADVETPGPKAEPRPEPTLAAAKQEPKPQEPAASSGPASADDLRELLQAVIDDDALTPYLRLTQPGRFPLRVSGHDLPKDIQLTKLAKPVVIVDDPSREPRKPVLVFTEIEIKGSEAVVGYKYYVEDKTLAVAGVRGTATLNKPYGHWAIKQSRVAEH
jgi:hypothetical protein